MRELFFTWLILFGTVAGARAQATTTGNLRSSAGQNTINVYNLDSVIFVDGTRYTTIQAALADLPSTGGQVIVPPGTYNISSTITNNLNNAYLTCAGGPGGPFYGNGGTPVTQPGSCILNWTGSPGGTIVSWNAPTTATQSIAGGGVSGFDFECNTTAGIGLHVANLWYGSFKNNFLDECTKTGLAVDNSPAIANGEATQFNVFENQSFKEVAAAGNCMHISGDPAHSSDSAFNTFINIRSASYNKGDCILIDEADNDRFYNIGLTLVSGGTGHGVHLTTLAGYNPRNCPGGGGRSALNCSAREEAFYGLDASGGPTGGGLVQDGYAASNTVYDYHTGNNAPQPSIGRTAGTLMYTEAGEGSSDMFLAFDQTNSTSPSPIVFNTNVSNPAFNTYIGWFDNGVSKWSVGRYNSTDDFAVVDGLNNIGRIYMNGNRNSSTVIDGTGNASVNFNTYAGSGTGGVLFYSGGPSPVLKVAIAGNGHINQGAAGTFAGTCTMTAGTSCTITLGAAYSSTPGCVVSVQSSAVIAGGCTVSGATDTISAASSNSSTWAAMLFGNPN